MRIALVLTLAACGATPSTPTVVHGDPPRAVPGVPALAEAGPHAFVGNEHGIVEVGATGHTQAITADPPSWCAVDARAQVVWFATASGVSAFDLVERRVHPIVTGDIGSTTIAIDHGTEHLGANSPVDYDVALAIHLTAKPGVGSQIGCDGDAAVYCYNDDDKLKPMLVERQQTLDALRPADPAYLATLVARGAKRSLWSPPPTPPAPPAAPAVHRAACTADATRCGELTAIPGSALWLVTTANSRGDFFHETRELWDPRTGEFVTLADGALVRAKRPRGEGGDFSELRIATSGLLSIAGVVFAPDRLIFALPDGMTCGWTDGWRIRGVRGDTGT